MSVSRWVATVVMTGAALVGAARPAAGWDNPKAHAPPRAKPHRRSAAEGVPPLPLPATPLRRTERKRPPAPPALVGMINFSNERFEIVEGRRRRVAAFPTTQIDIERLMRVANNRLGVRYRYVATTLGGFSWNPRELPLLYLTGWTPVPDLGETMRARLRRYLYDGGTLVVHAQCGREAFVTTARKMIARLLPHRELAPIDTDSPLLHAHFTIDRMRVRRGTEPFKRMKPYLEAVYLGCRPAVIFSPIDLNCGWNVVKHPIPGGTLYHQNDAAKLGVNIVATTLANFEYARAWSAQKVYHQQDADTRDQLVIAQLVHGGDWDPTPHALPNLMKYVLRNTTLNVQFKRKVLDPAQADVFAHPVLYMTGLRDFAFSDEQTARLRRYLHSGGVLIVDAAAGRKAFDVAFRREIARVLPDRSLDVLPVESPVYRMPYEIRGVDYTRLAEARHGERSAPMLEGITIDGQLAVIYSSLSLSSGWEELGFAFARGYATEDALRIGVNLLAYAMTH
ncbi:MAG: DUF4159 domain-containing protein [Phycisphaerae bacterium]|nr:DUF4159 domain-containing protein [Phycisphaerae bacterium]